MKRRASFIVLLLIFGAFLAGMGALYRLRLGLGDAFPQYSTLRADPLGTRALFEGLQELPGLQVARSLQGLKKLPERPVRTIVLAGVDRRAWESFRVEDGNALEAAVRAGSRLIVAFKAERMSVNETAEPVNVKGAKAKKGAGKKEQAKEETTADKQADKSAPPAPRGSPRNREEAPRVAQTVDWARRWGAELRTRWIMDGELGALTTAGAPEDFPGRVAWKSDLHFSLTQGAEWRTLYTRGGSPVLVEMPLGRGSVVLAADSYFLSNEAMQKDRASGLLAWLVGGNPRVVFVESHLGVEENPGVAALARRYGLAGAFLVLLVLAALFVWQRMALFVPPAPESEEVALSYHPAAGLEALLRRAVAGNKLVETCFAEWARTARAGEVAKVRAAFAEPAAAKASPVESYNRAVRALRQR